VAFEVGSSTSGISANAAAMLMLLAGVSEV
jgi:hypothetical protein